MNKKLLQETPGKAVVLTLFAQAPGNAADRSEPPAASQSWGREFEPDRLGGANRAASRKNKHPSPGTKRPDSHATTTCRAQLDCTTAERMVRFDWGVAHEAAAGTSEGGLFGS